MMFSFSFPGCDGSVSPPEAIDCGHPPGGTWRSYHKVSAVCFVGMHLILRFIPSLWQLELSVGSWKISDNWLLIASACCCCRPLPQEEMKNIIFNVFGEDMSTGVVTQVKYTMIFIIIWVFVIRLNYRCTLNSSAVMLVPEQTVPLTVQCCEHFAIIYFKGVNQFRDCNSVLWTFCHLFLLKESVNFATETMTANVT